MHNAPSWVEDGSEVKLVEGNCAIVEGRRNISASAVISHCQHQHMRGELLVLHISNAEE